jgi:hypothetical protein
MNARQLIDGAWYGPEALMAIGQAFDQAWHQIAPYFGDDPIDVEKARIRLAHALLTVADNDSRDVSVLKKAGLQRMASITRSVGIQAHARQPGQWGRVVTALRNEARQSVSTHPTVPFVRGVF